MNQETKINLIRKIFIFFSIFINIVFLTLIVLEIRSLIDIRNEIQYADNSIKSLNDRKKINNLEQINNMYFKIVNANSSENTLGELIKFIENETLFKNLTIRDTKVLSVTDNEIKYQITIEGEMENIYNFINTLESDKNPKEIESSEIEIRGNKIRLNLNIKGYIL